MVKASLSVMALLLAGCAGGNGAKSGNDDFQVIEDQTSVHILAYANGDVWGEVLLEKGVFQQLDENIMAEGRRLTVKKGAMQVVHVSSGFPDLNLPMLTGNARGLNDLLLAPEVSEPLARWGVHFDTKSMTGPSEVAPEPTDTTGEVPYLNGCKAFNQGTNYPYNTCGGCTHGFSGSCGETACTEWNQPYSGGTEADEFVACGGSGFVLHRSCTTYPGTSSCGTNGPSGGCAVCWAQAYGDCATTYCVGGTAFWLNGILWCGNVAC